MANSQCGRGGAETDSAANDVESRHAAVQERMSASTLRSPEAATPPAANSENSGWTAINAFARYPAMAAAGGIVQLRRQSRTQEKTRPKPMFAGESAGGTRLD